MTSAGQRDGVARRIIISTFKILFPSAAERIQAFDDIVAEIEGVNPDSLEGRELPRRLADASDRISARLSRIEEIEFRGLEKAERSLAVAGVEQALAQMPVSAADVIKEAITTEQLRSALAPIAERRWRSDQLGDDALAYGRVYLTEAAAYISALVHDLPGFQSRVAWETYVNTKKLEAILERGIAGVVLPKFRPGLSRELSNFEAGYRSDITNTYKYTDMFGLKLPVERRRHPVDVTYVRLRTLADDSAADDFGGTAITGRVAVDPKIDSAIGELANIRKGQRRSTRILLTGSAGSGKTTISQWLAISMAQRRLPEAMAAWTDFLPLITQLRYVFKANVEPEYQDMIRASMYRGPTVPESFVKDCLDRGDAVAIFDGLDELSDHDTNRALTWIDNLMSEHPKAHIFVTSRPDVLDNRWFQLRGFVTLQLLPMNDEEAEECIDRWFDVLISGTSDAEKIAEFRRRHAKLVYDLQNRQNVRDLSRTPLLCAMLCAFYAYKLPDAIEQLLNYRRRVLGPDDTDTITTRSTLSHRRRQADGAATVDQELLRELRHAFDVQTSLRDLGDPTSRLQLHMNRHPVDAAEVLELLAELRSRGSLNDRAREVLAELFKRGEVGSSGISSIGSAPKTGRRPERLLVARAPTRVPVGRDLSVDVRIVSKGHSVPTDAVMSPMVGLIVAHEGTPVTVTIHVPAGLRPEGSLQQTVLLQPSEDPAPIRFGFSARTPGLHRIDVTAWAGGTFLAEVSVEVSADVGGAFRDGQPKVASLGAASARPGEVTMEVRFNGGQYTFQLRSDAALFAPVVESVANTPNVAVENAIKELQQLAAGSSQYSATMTRQVIRSAGIQLWSEMVPADIRDQFWQVGADMSAFTIATDYDLVPWELLYPLNADNDAGFLVEQVPVVRRTYGQRRTPAVGLGNPRFVVPPKAPAGVQDEIAAVTAILGAAHSNPITKADELLALINSGDMGATHFACHNTFSADGSSIDMDGGRFRPALLAEAAIRRTLERTGPLVFINACRSAGTAPTYTKMLGWAQQFMSSGAGAFVGTLWAVRTESSARFATAFYRSLADGATLGTAAFDARTEQQEDPLDPTWLAYTVYGDPFATATRETRPWT